MTTVLILGASGQLGIELCRARLPERWSLRTPDRNGLDLAAPGNIDTALGAIQPALIINAAAYTAVDKAESEVEAAFALNRDGPAALARAAARRSIPLVHVSTDYVFSGEAPRSYREEDPKSPLGVYGRSKAEGEDAVLANHPHAAIVRTSWVFSAHRSNFVKTMLRLGEDHDEVRVVADQIGRPTAAGDLAETCVALGSGLLTADPNAAGIFHFANSGDATWADFAEAIFERAAERGRRPVAVRRIATSDYPTLAKRPANSRLDTSKIQSLLGSPPRSWREALEPCLEELLPS